MSVPASPPIRFLFLLSLLACFLTISQSALPPPATHAQASAARQQPAGSPSPSPSDSLRELQPKKRSALRKVFAFLRCDIAKHTKEQELYKTGQQLPESYQDNDFSLVALTKGGWPVGVNYRVEPGADATITFRVKDVEPFTEKLPATIGMPSPPDPVLHYFHLPDRFGERPQATLISIKAVMHTTTAGDLPASFQFVGLGIGDMETKPTSSTRQPAGMNFLKVSAPSPGAQTLHESNSGPLRASPTRHAAAGYVDVVRIASVDVAPSSLTPAGEFEYSFVSTGKFGKWSSALHKNTQVLVKGQLISGTMRLPPTAKFNELVSVGRNPAFPLTKRWTIKKGRFAPGDYKIGVSAQATANEGVNAGKSASRISPVVRIK